MLGFFVKSILIDLRICTWKFSPPGFLGFRKRNRQFITINPLRFGNLGNVSVVYILSSISITVVMLIWKKNRFTEKRSLQIHMRKHTGERPYSCDFPGCGKRFTQSGILSTHKLTHDDEKREKCQLCGKLFRQKFHLQLHMKRHEGTKKFFCKQCPFSFLTKSDFDRHCLTHTGNFTYYHS